MIHVELLTKHYRLVHSNGQILATSEVYYSHWNAKRAARRIARDFQLELIEKL